MEEVRKLIEDVAARLGRVERLLSELAQRQATPSQYLTIEQAAAVAGVSETLIRRARKRGQLAASNVGSSQKPLWRIAHADLIAWVERNKGGTTSIPPESELDDLIKRHLPGLRGRKESATR